MRVRFILDEVDSMNVLVDGQHVLSWRQTEGDVTKDVPPAHANKCRIHIRVDGIPNGRGWQMQVFFDGALMQHMDSGHES